MRRISCLMGVTALLGSVLALAAPAGAAPAHASATLSANHLLAVGQHLESADGRYRATVGPSGRLVVRGPAHHLVWRSPAAGPGAHVTLSRTGQVLLKANGRTAWRTGTAGAGRAARLTMRNSGVLTLTVGRALVWSTRLPNVCPHTAGKTVVVHIGGQSARACDGGQQLRAFRVTTGAVERGDGTPRGTWHVQSKVRNTTLYPSAGGAYPVHFWVPYDGAYGIHDSPWQKFAYGSPKYRTHGSHGCTHVPETTMKWLYAWLRIGTTVTIS